MNAMNKLLATLVLALALPVAALAADAPAAKAPAKAAPAAAKGAPAAKATPAAAPVAPGKLFDAIRKRGTLLVGVAWSLPWAMRDPQGEWQGFEIDIARQLAADLGVDMTLVRVPFVGLTEALLRNRVDIVIAGYSITPQRALVVDFSNQYADSQMELVVRKDLAAQDVNRADVRIGARAGTTTEAAARSRLPLATISTYPTERELYAALKDGSVDGALAYAPRSTVAVAQTEGRFAVSTGIAGLPHTVEAFAVRKGEQELLNFLNAWIAYWGADGWIAERHKYWFETLDWTARLAPADAAK